MIKGYHSCNRDILYKNVDFTNPSLLGLEIEIDIPTKTEELAKEAISLGPIFAERDSSLNRDTGVEFIFAPTPLDQITEDSFIGKWAKLLNGQSKAWKMRNHGMHINVNASSMSNLHVGKFCHFFNSNKEFSVKMAGRDHYGYNESLEDTYYSGDRLSIESYSLYEESRFAPAMKREQRIEVRMFQSSTNFRRIRQNCELVNSVRMFTQTAKVEELTPDHYMNWLLNNSEGYEVLCNRLLTAVAVEE